MVIELLWYSIKVEIIFSIEQAFSTFSSDDSFLNVKLPMQVYLLSQFFEIYFE